MSRHVPRSERWTFARPNEGRSAEGMRVYFLRGVWWAEVAYGVLAEDAPPGEFPTVTRRTDRLGPFPRPRNAMVAAERHATMLRNRHADRFQFEDAGGEPAA